MKHSIRVCLPIMLLCFSLCTHVSWAGDEKAEAAKHFEKGVSLFKNEDYAAALIEFEAAYEAHPHFAVRYNLAVCLYKLHHYADAANQIQRYLSEGGDDVPKSKRIEVEGILEEMESLVGSIKVKCNVEDADVFVNGKLTDKANSIFPIQLDVGQYEVEVRAEDYKPFITTIKLPGGSLKTIEVELVKGGDDGLSFSAAGMDHMPSRKNVPAAAFWSIAGLTATLALTASITGGIALKKEKDYADLGVYDDWQNAQKSGRNLVIATDVLWGVAGASAVTTVILIFFTDFSGSEKAETSLTVSPDLLCPGLVLKGVF